MSIPSIIQSRTITQLVHFTPFSNLLGVFECGGVIPRRDLLERARALAATGEQFLLDYITFNDDARFDNRTDCVNLSIQHPNTALFDSFRHRFPGAIPWFVLLLDPQLCADPGVVFTTGNAASSIVRSEGAGTGETAFERIFAPTVVAGSFSTGRQMLVRPDALPACLPTNPQAEVLYPGTIPCSRILSIAVETAADLRQIRTALLTEGVNVDALSFILKPEMFKRR